MDPEKIMSGISNEIYAVLKAMEKVKVAEEKRVYSETVKNLCDSLGVFLNLLSDMSAYDDELDELDDIEDLDDDERTPF